MKKNIRNILILHGPNLNYLGKREPHIYGKLNQKELINKVKSEIKKKDNKVKVSFFQSNSEGEIIDHLYKTNKSIDAIIFNLGAYTHTSIAIRDCLVGIKENKIYVEVHLSNPEEREAFRKTNFFRDIVDYYASGLKIKSYFQAIDFLFK